MATVDDLILSIDGFSFVELNERDSLPNLLPEGTLDSKNKPLIDPHRCPTLYSWFINRILSQSKEKAISLRK
jgi:hypothetical protein